MVPDATAVDPQGLETPQEMAAETRALNKAPFASAEKLATAKELVRTLAVAHTNAALYPVTHPLVQQSLDDLVDAVDAVLLLGFEDVAINIYKNTLFVENQVFPEESVTYRKLIEELLARGISALTFAPGLSTADVGALIGLLFETKISHVEDATVYLEQRGVSRISLAETSALDSAEEEVRSREVKAAARESYDAGIAAMRDVEMHCKLGKVFDVNPLQHIVAAMLDSLLRDPAAVLGLTAIKSHDDYTLNHSINVCIMSLSLGAALALDDESLHSLGLSALLYDLGKVRIPEEILSKQGPLTNEEWNVVKSHSEEGADLLKRIQLVDQMPMIVAYEHHQRHDLQGYPEPVAEGQEQHLFSKVVAISDAYDAMTTRRPFRREIRPDKALAVLMQGRGKAYDPDIVKSFVALLGIYPMGAVVMLDDRRIGVVYRVNNDDLLHPRVKVLIDADGRWLDEAEVLDLRLIDPDTGAYARSIAECLPAVEAGVDDVWQYL
jgi:HD-GYP domain-containing protein (c-di-GMP phosphodiesterase class II)